MRAWSPPSEFEEYRLVRVLGSGAMGTVWLAHDLNLDRAVAVKFISEAAAGGEARDRFFVEARAVARLHHPNVVTVHRVGEVDGRPYLISEYVRGTTLDKLARPIPVAQAFDLALGLARGLAAAHRHGVLHRDVKPANAIVTPEGEVKLLDFGLAKLFGQLEPAAGIEPPPELGVLDTMRKPSVLATPPRAAALQTEVGVVMGTPAYLAPEVWQGHAATAAADVYALGATLFHLLCDRLPHQAPTPLALAARVAAEDAPPLRSLRADCPAALAEVIDACLARDLAIRPPGGEAVREALELRARAARRPALPEGNPYRGLSAFGAEHRHLFFGRELEIADVLERLRSDPWVVVAGRSGAGKSSLVRAGVVPRVVEDGALAEGAEGPARWRALALVPGARPRAALVAAAAALLGRDEAELARALDDDPGRLARELRADRRTGTLIFVDQLEELVTLAEPAERDGFAEALRHLLTPSPALRVVATLRSDYVGHLDAVHRELTRALYVLGPMTPEGVRDAVVAPAAAHGVSFEAEADVEALAEAALASLPLVEFALAKLWEQRDVAGKRIGRDALARIGGVEGALARHADEVIAGLSPAGAREARRILLRLVTAERTRARRGEADLVAGAADEALVRSTLEALLRGRLLASGEAGYEVAHEALIGSWPRLRLWLDEEQGAHQARERLEVAAADWERLGRRPEALWSGRRLGELDLLAGAPLPPRERAFAETSRRADRRRRWSRRLLLVGVVAALAAGSLVLWAQNREAQDQRRRAEQRVTEQLAEQGRQYLLAGDAMKAIVYLAEAFARGDRGPAMRFMLGRAVFPFAAQRSMVTGHRGRVWTVRFSPDGDDYVTASSDGTAKVWSLARNELVHSLEGHRDVVFDARFSPDGRAIVTASWDGTARVWDRATGRLRFILAGHADRVREASFSPDGRWILTTAREPVARVWDARMGTLRAAFAASSGRCSAESWSPDGALVVLGESGGATSVWSVATGKRVLSLAGEGKVESLGVSPDGSLAAVASGDEVRLWNLRTGAAVATLSGHTAPIRRVAFSPDGRLLVSSSEDGSARLWDVGTGRTTRTLVSRGEVLQAVFTADGRRVATTSVDGTVRIWLTAGGTLLATLVGHGDAATWADFHPSQPLLVTTSFDGTTRVWRSDHDGAIARFGEDLGALAVDIDARSQTVAVGGERGAALFDVRAPSVRRPLAVAKLPVNSVKLSPDGGLVATAGGALEIWDAARQTRLLALPAAEVVNGVSWSRDGAHLFTASAGGKVRAWNVSSGELEREIAAHSGDAYDAEPDASGTRILSAGQEAVAYLWDLESGARVQAFRGHALEIYRAALSADASRAVTASLDKTARVWDVASGGQVSSLEAHANEVFDARFSPDGALVATGGTDGTVRIWEAESGKLLWTQPTDAGAVYGLAFSQDGRLVVTSGSPVQVWGFEGVGVTDSLPPAVREALARVPFRLNGGRLVRE